MSDLRTRITDAILSIGTVEPCCAHMAADKVIAALGLRLDDKVIPLCEDGCRMFRWVTEWTADV